MLTGTNCCRMLAAMLFLVVGLPASGQEAALPFQEPGKGDWYRPVEPELWSSHGGEPAVIDETLRRIAAATGTRADPNLPDTITAHGPGHWTFEFAAAGEAALAEAERAADPAVRRAKAKAATIYFHIASAPHTNEPHQLAALAKAGKAYLVAGGERVSKVEIPFEGKTFEAYLHLPAGPGPFPLVVHSYGSDVAKEVSLTSFEKHFGPKGIALLSLDTPGMGGSLAYDVRDGIADKLHIAAVDWARRQASVDGRNIFVRGISFGGLAAMRAWLARQDRDLAGVIHFCGPLSRPFLAPPQVYAGLPAFTTDGVKARVGLEPRDSFEELAARVRPLSLAGQGLFEGGKIDTPILVITTNRDPVAPLEDLDKALARGTRVKRFVLDQPGHCMDHFMRDAVASAWILDQLR